MNDNKNEITAAELLQRMRSGKDIFMLDVRTEEDYDAWKIEDMNTPHTVNIPYIDFIEEPEKMSELAPRDREVVVLCAKGGASNYVAEILRGANVDAVNIAGGMKAWGRLYKDSVVWDEDEAKVIQYIRVGKGCISYLIVSGKNAALVDAARHIDQYAEYIDKNDLTLTHVFDTHLHADHISGGYDVAKKYGAKYHMSPADMDWAKINYESLEDGQTIKIGSSSLQVVAISTPGHTPGSTCYILDGKVMFTGDTLFVSSLGRPDLGGKAHLWVKDLYKTVRKLHGLDDGMTILPAHTAGPVEYDKQGRVFTTLGEVKNKNELFAMSDADFFACDVLRNIPEEPEAYQSMRLANLGEIDPEEDKRELWELGRNRCAIEAAAESTGK